MLIKFFFPFVTGIFCISVITGEYCIILLMLFSKQSKPMASVSGNNVALIKCASSLLDFLFVVITDQLMLFF